MNKVRLSSRTLVSSSCQCLRQHSPSTAAGVRSYNVSKFAPIQPPPVTSPASPYFVPRKLGQTTRLSTYYDEIVAPNMLLMSYDPTAKREKQLLPLRWDGTSPYHKNRPQPRVQLPPKLHHPMNTKNIPKIKSITVHSMVKSSIIKRPDLLNAALAVQSITGQRPEFIHSKSSVQTFKLRPRIPIAVKAVLKGPVMLAFLSILSEVVLPQVKDFEGVHYVQNEKSGSINFGFKGSAMALFPQIAANFDSFTTLPGFDIGIATTATTTADARLLLSAYGIPFKKGSRHVPKKPIGGDTALRKYRARHGR